MNHAPIAALAGTGNFAGLSAVPSIRWRLLWMLRLLGVLVAGHFTLAYLHGTYHYLDIPRYAAGQERLPFQDRALTGWLLRGLLQLPGLRGLTPDGPASMLRPDLMAWAILVFGATLWIQRAARQAASVAVADPLAARACALAVMPVLYINYEAIANAYRPSYAYDLPSLALFVACFAALVQDRRRRLLILFVPACLARETSLLLVPIFLCWHWFDAAARRRALITASVMAAIWLAARLLVARLYAGNPLNPQTVHLAGASAHGLELQFFANLRMLANPLHLANLASAGCWLWLPVVLFWRYLDDRRLRAAILLCTPPLVAGMMMVGRVAEVRVFAELSVVYWLAVVVIAGRLLEERKVLF
jgi:hypothetical protein